MKEFTAYMPTKVLFGAGVLNELKNQTLPGDKALILLSDGTSAIKNGYYDRVKSLLEEAGVRTETFKGIEANPLKDTVMKAAAFAQDKGCDFVVMLGGGSVMDAGKAVAAMATNEGDLWDYVNGGTGKGKPLAKAPLPTVAVTTTAGTGSEVDAWGVVSGFQSRNQRENRFRRRRQAFPDAFDSRPRTYAHGSACLYRLSGFRRAFSQYRGLYREFSQRVQRYGGGKSHRIGGKISSRCGKRRKKSRSEKQSCVGKHFVGIRYGLRVYHKRTFH